ncbi:MAG TPA: hypothetical protein VJX67_04815, partial [Blastocatellia bacterium]|nr:hypothetical protein [Blastocatellia bacterium]
DQSKDFQFFLPGYLSPSAEAKLFEELRSFPENIDKRVYSDPVAHGDLISQGDGLKRLLVVDLPSTRTKEGPVLVVSNSCDIDVSNRRRLPPRIMYCPILPLRRYVEWITGVIGNPEGIDGHVSDIKRQRISSIFYLPCLNDIFPESIALLDRVNNCSLDYLYESSERRERFFSLSDYGFYLFIYKISVHLTRMQEGFERG